MTNRLNSEYVAHRVEPGRAAGEPAGCAERAARERIAALRAMDQFEALAIPAEASHSVTRHSARAIDLNMGSARSSQGVTATFTIAVVQQHWKPPPPSPE